MSTSVPPAADHKIAIRTIFKSGDRLEQQKIMKYFCETPVSENRLQELSLYVTEDCILKIGDRILPLGLKGVREHLIAVRITYPDLTMRLLKQHVDGDYVISEFIMEGTHEGEWLGITPTHKKTSITGVNIDRVINGRLSEHGGAANTFEALWENGLIRPM